MITILYYNFLHTIINTQFVYFQLCFTTRSYQLNTAAGFLINRHAVLSLTSVSGAENSVPKLHGLIAATTDKRWRQNGMEEALRNIAQSFRVNKISSGVFSTEIDDDD